MGWCAVITRRVTRVHTSLTRIHDMKRNKTTPTSWDLILFIQIREAGGDHVRRDVVTCRQRVTVGPLRVCAVYVLL